jgi:hypothetical protein
LRVSARYVVDDLRYVTNGVLRGLVTPVLGKSHYISFTFDRVTIRRSIAGLLYIMNTGIEY